MSLQEDRLAPFNFPFNSFFVYFLNTVDHVVTNLLPDSMFEIQLDPMSISRNPVFWCLIISLFVATIGCKSPDINPSSSRPGRGYADLFTEPKEDVWWKVDVFDSQDQGYKEFTAQFETPQFSILRVEARPGKHKARIELVNRIVESPIELEVDIREGMITPIRVTMAPAGKSEVRVREDRGRWERSRVKQYGEQMWKLSAKAEPPIPYTPKQSMAYWK